MAQKPKVMVSAPTTCAPANPPRVAVDPPYARLLEVVTRHRPLPGRRRRAVLDAVPATRERPLLPQVGCDHRLIAARSSSLHALGLLVRPRSAASATLHHSLASHQPIVNDAAIKYERTSRGVRRTLGMLLLASESRVPLNAENGFFHQLIRPKSPQSLDQVQFLGKAAQKDISPQLASSAAQRLAST